MKKIGFIGFGNMASAIALGIINAKFLNANEIIAYDIDENKAEKMCSYHIDVAHDIDELIACSEFIFVGVKPQVVESVLDPYIQKLENKAIISIALGYDFDKYQTFLDDSTRHIFVMPNTPVRVLQGMSLIEEKHSLKDQEFEFVKNMFSAIGQVEVVSSHLMSTAGTLSGCGPAFVYMIIEALADGAVKEGVPREMAYTLASQTLMGAAKMQLETHLHPGVLKDQVCSPGGSTICGVEALEDGKLRATLISAISAAVHYQEKK